jgi:hypothetical protein
MAAMFAAGDANIGTPTPKIKKCYTKATQQSYVKKISLILIMQ